MHIMVCHGRIILFGLFLLSLSRNGATSGLPGNITIAGFFQVYEPANDGCSDDIVFSSIQHFEAVKWIFRKLNIDNYIPGITIGLSIHPTCRKRDIASEATFELLRGMRSPNDGMSHVFAAIGPDFSEDAAVISGILSSLPLTERIAQIGFSTTASDLADTSLHPNLFRVIPNDSHQIKVMVSLMTKMNWNYIAIIYEDDTYGRGGAIGLKNLAQEKAICVRLIAPLPVVSSGAIILSELHSVIRNISLTRIGGLVFFGSTNKAKVLLSTIQIVAKDIAEIPSIIFSDGVDLEKDVFQEQKYVTGPGKGVFIISPTKREMPEFLTHWQTIFTDTVYLLEEASTNPWLLDIFENIQKCLPSANDKCVAMTNEEVENKLPESVYASHAVEAALVIAKGILLTLQKTCGEENTCKPGELIETLNDISVNFSHDFPGLFIGDHITQFDASNEIIIRKNISIYDVYNFIDSKQGFYFCKVGKWENDILDIDMDLIRGYLPDGTELMFPNTQKAQCPHGKVCSECLISFSPYVMYYEPGDVVFVGFLPVFNKGGDPLTCAGIRTAFGLQVVQGLIFIIEKANEKAKMFKDIFPKMKVGIVIIDSCNSALVTEEALIKLFRKGIHLANGTFLNINSNIIGFIGEQGSTATMAGYNVIGRMNYVQVSYASTSPLLSDKHVFPLLMRAVPSDEKQGNAIIDIAKELNFTYIQVVYSVGGYGEGGRDSILKAARKKNICVAQVIAVDEFRDYNKILNELRKEWHAKFVVIFLRSHITGDVMEKITDKMNDIEFTFIGSEAWGLNKNNLRKNTKLMGSLTMSIQMVQNSEFSTYLNHLHSDSYPNNPWLQSYIEKKLDCYYSDSFNKSAKRECTNSDKLASDPDFQQDIWTPFAMNTLIAFILAAGKTFNELCGNIQFLCPSFHDDPNALIKNMKLIELDTQKIGRHEKLFDDNGDGMMDYKIYNIQQSENDSTKLIYKHVGDVPFGKPLQLRYNELKLVEGLVSVCPNSKVCSECFPDDTPPMDENEEEDIVQHVLVGLLGASLLAFLILLVISCYCWRRLKKKTIVSGYINPTSSPGYMDGDYSVPNMN